MTDTIWITVLLCGIPVMLLLRRLSGKGHTIRSVLLYMFFGIAALIAVNLCSGFTGVAMPVSRLTLTCSALLGIPGVTAMLLLQMFF